MMEKVSVIVPIFNNAPYLKQCLDSIVGQTYPHLEILLLNDGSTDGSAAICEEYRQKDERIHLVHRPLGGSGVGAVRNAALSMITGDYVVFVDNDDWLEPNHVEFLYRSLKEHQADVAVANFTQFMEDRGTFGFHIRPEDYYQQVYTPQEWFQEQYNGHFSLSQCFTVPWGKLYRTELFEGIFYPEDKPVEDDYTTWRLYLMADRIVFTNTGLYCHRKCSSSVTKTVDTLSVFPLKSIEERIPILSLLGFDIRNELRAYRFRLTLHKESLLATGRIKEYQSCVQTLKVLEKWKK